MHEYDTVLERITGDKINRWLNVEFPEVRQTRVDLLGETAEGELMADALNAKGAKQTSLPQLRWQCLSPLAAWLRLSAVFSPNN